VTHLAQSPRHAPTAPQPLLPLPPPPSSHNTRSRPSPCPPVAGTAHQAGGSGRCRLPRAQQLSAPPVVVWFAVWLGLGLACGCGVGEGLYGLGRVGGGKAVGWGLGGVRGAALIDWIEQGGDVLCCSRLPPLQRTTQGKGCIGWSALGVKPGRCWQSARSVVVN